MQKVSDDGILHVELVPENGKNLGDALCDLNLAMRDKHSTPTVCSLSPPNEQISCAEEAPSPLAVSASSSAGQLIPERVVSKFSF